MTSHEHSAEVLPVETDEVEEVQAFYDAQKASLADLRAYFASRSRRRRGTLPLSPTPGPSMDRHRR